MTALRIELSYPSQELSPNARVHRMVEHRFKKAAKIEAGWATKFVLGLNQRWAPETTPIPVHLIAHPMPTGPHPDADNFVASCKAYLDGIANAIGVNDRDFNAPTVEWGERCARGKLIVVVG